MKIHYDAWTKPHSNPAGGVHWEWYDSANPGDVPIPGDKIRGTTFYGTVAYREWTHDEDGAPLLYVAIDIDELDE